MKRGRFSEEQRHGNLARNVLHLAEQVRRSGGVGDAPLRQLRGREPAAEVDCWPTRRGYSGAQGRYWQKKLQPAVKRLMVAEIMTTA
jgi:hypothetical protein